MSDALVGLMAGYVVWSNLVPETHKATAVTEQIVGRRLGPAGRDLVTTAVLIRDTPLPPRPQTPAAPVVDETADPDGADESDETGESADPAGD